MLIMFFIISSSAVFLYFFALKVDRRYSDLIETESEISTNIYSIASIHSRNINILFNALYTDQPDSILKYKSEWETNIAKSASFLDKLSKQIFLTGQDKEPVNDLASLEKNHTELCMNFFDIKNTKGKDTAFVFLRKKVNPSYRTYRDKLEMLLNINNRKLLEISQKLTVENQKTGLIYLTIGAIPFFFLLIYFLSGFALIIYLAFQYFRSDNT